MLDILEDYLIASDISYGRIDGDIQGRQRQKVCSYISVFAFVVELLAMSRFDCR